MDLDDLIDYFEKLENENQELKEKIKELEEELENATDHREDM